MRISDWCSDVCSSDLSLDADARAEIQEQVNEAQAELEGHAEVVATAERISERLIAIAGEQHAVPLTLGLSPTRVDALLRSLRLLIDNGARGIADASLGTGSEDRSLGKGCFSTGRARGSPHH